MVLCVVAPASSPDRQVVIRLMWARLLVVWPVGPFTVNATSSATSNGTALDFGSNTIDVTLVGTAAATLKVWVTLSGLMTGLAQSSAIS